MLPTRRAQPYRQDEATREPGMALEAMLRGASQAGPQPHARHEAQSALQDLLHSFSQRPSATADTRGTFAQPAAPTDMHSLLMEQLRRRRQAVAVPRGE